MICRGHSSGRIAALSGQNSIMVCAFCAACGWLGELKEKDVIRPTTYSSRQNVIIRSAFITAAWLGVPCHASKQYGITLSTDKGPNCYLFEQDLCLQRLGTTCSKICYGRRRFWRPNSHYTITVWPVWEIVSDEPMQKAHRSQHYISCKTLAALDKTNYQSVPKSAKTSKLQEISVARLFRPQ